MGYSQGIIQRVVVGNLVLRQIGLQVKGFDVMLRNMNFSL